MSSNNKPNHRPANYDAVQRVLDQVHNQVTTLQCVEAALRKAEDEGHIDGDLAPGAISVLGRCVGELTKVRDLLDLALLGRAP
jgi:hypothetical protein